MGAVGNLQMMLRARYIRLPSLFPEERYEPAPFELDFHPPAGEEAFIRFRHVRKLVIALAPNKSFETRIDAF